MSDLEKNVSPTTAPQLDSIPISRPSLTIVPHPDSPENQGNRPSGRSHSVSSGGGLSAVEKDSFKKGGLTANGGSDCVAVVSVPALGSGRGDSGDEGEEVEDEGDEDAEGELKMRRLREAETAHRPPGKVGRVLLPTFAALTLAWWVSGLIVKETKHQWIPRTIWAWFFLLITLFRFVPASIVSKPIGRAWSTLVASPVSQFSDRVKLAMLWACALAITFGTAFGSTRPSGTQITDRVISLSGIFFTQLVLVSMAHDKKLINWYALPRSLILQQALALFILRSDAGIKFFTWINSAVSDFQSSAVAATALIFDADTTAKGWFFVTGLATMIFLTSWVQMLYFFNWMQWFTKQFAFLGYHVLSASGAETFVALWSPWFGQVHSAILINPYADTLTNSEIASIMTTSMSSISSLMILSYTTTLSIPLRTLIAISGILMPGAIMNAKIVFPSPPAPARAPLTETRFSTHANRKKINLRRAVDLLDCLSDGALLGLKIAGWVLTNFFCILALLVLVDGLLIYTFRSFGIHALDLHLVLAAPLAPFTFFLGVPRNEVWRTAYILSGKLLVNSDFAMAALNAAMAGKGAANIGPGSGAGPLSDRAYNVMVGALANAANLGSLGIQVGVMVALAPRKKRVICKAAIPALLVATVSTIQAACIAASLF